MADECLVSIIVPVYNAQDSIQTAIDSVVSQDYQLTELILVDDGSNDNTQEICCKNVDKDKRIHYLRQANKGVSSARNNGLKASKGKYVMFLDADDSLADNAIKHLTSLAEARGADIVIGCYNEVSDFDVPKEISKSEAITAALNVKETIKNVNMGSPWAKLFSRKLFTENQIFFDESLSHREDLIFDLMAYANSEKIVIVNKLVYYYTTNNSESLVRRFNDNKIDELGNLIKSIEGFNKNIYKLDDDILKHFVMQTVYTGWSDYYTHVNNHQSFSQDLKIMRNSLLSNKLSQYWDNNSLKQGTDYSKYQRIIISLMHQNKYCMLEIISIIVRIIKRCL